MAKKWADMDSAEKKQGLVGLVLLVVIGLVAFTMCSGDDQSAASVPPYKIVQQDDSGNSRDITVEVDTDEDLKAVFEDIVEGLDDEAGYHVLINCSTGGSAAYDNRLANGRHAIGRMGAATTGLEPGGSVFELVRGQACPAD